MTDDAASPSGSALVLIDGTCNLCNGWVRFLLPRDKDKRLRFGSQQSQAGRAALAAAGLAPQVGGDQESIVYIEDGTAYQQSTAALRILTQLGGIWTVLAGMGRIFPAPLRDVIYRWVARNRYKLFGQQDHCRILVPGEEDRFLPED